MTTAKPTILVLMSESEAKDFRALTMLIERFFFYFASTPEVAGQIVDDKRPDLLLLGTEFNSDRNIGSTTLITAFSRTHYLPIVAWRAGTSGNDIDFAYSDEIDDSIAFGQDQQTYIAVLLAVLRRTRPATISQRSEIAGLTIDEGQRRIYFNEREVPVTPTQFRIIAALLDEPSRKLTRAELLRRVWGLNSSVELRTVDQNVARLQSTLRTKGADNIIKAVRGFGYQISV